QDNEISWQDWTLSRQDLKLLDFTRKLIALRQEHPVFCRRNFFHGRDIRGGSIKDICWLTPQGEEMTDEEWDTTFARCLGVYFGGEAMQEKGRRGQVLLDDNFLLLVNAYHESVHFTLPDFHPERRWHVLLDTNHAEGLESPGDWTGGSVYQL